jgi:hypothetical protein
MPRPTSPTATPDVEKPERVRFRSRGVNYSLTVVPARTRLTDFGKEDLPGRRISFAPDGEYVTDDPEEIAAIRATPMLNLEVFEVGAEPDAIPASDEVLDRIMQAAMELDAETLEAIEATEVAGYNRRDVLASVRSARLRVSGDED